MRRVVHYAAAPVPGGLITHLSLLAARTADRGYRSEAWIRPVEALDAAAADLSGSGVPVRRLTVKGKADLPGLLAFARALRKSDPEILHVHLASPVESLPVIFLAGWIGRARIIATEHAPTHHPTERAWSRAARAAAFRRVDRIVALARQDADYLRERFGAPPGKIRCIANGVPLPSALPSRREARCALAVPETSAVIAYAGEIAEKKGLLDLVAAMERIGERDGGPVALLAGEGAFAPALHDRIRAAGLGDRCRLLGRLSRTLDLYAACDIFVLPSHGEGMPMALLEAMAAGRPVVATRVGGVPDVVRDGMEGRLVPPHDSAALAAALTDLLADAAARERMGSAARKRIEEGFEIRKMVDATCSLYDEILSGAPS